MSLSKASILIAEGFGGNWTSAGTCPALLLFLHSIHLCPLCVIIPSWESSSLDICSDSYLMPSYEMQISPSSLKFNKTHSGSLLQSCRKSTVLPFIFANIQTYVFLLSTGSEFSNLNCSSRFIHVQPFPPKTDMEVLHFFNSHPVPNPSPNIPPEIYFWHTWWMSGTSIIYNMMWIFKKYI